MPTHHSPFNRRRTPPNPASDHEYWTPVAVELVTSLGDRVLTPPQLRRYCERTLRWSWPYSCHVVAHAETLGFLVHHFCDGLWRVTTAGKLAA